MGEIMSNIKHRIKIVFKDRISSEDFQSIILLKNRIINLENYRDTLLKPINIQIADVERQIEIVKQKNQGFDFTKEDFQTIILLKKQLIKLRNEMQDVLNRINPEISELQQLIDSLGNNSKTL